VLTEEDRNYHKIDFELILLVSFLDSMAFPAVINNREGFAFTNRKVFISSDVMFSEQSYLDEYYSNVPKFNDGDCLFVDIQRIRDRLQEAITIEKIHDVKRLNVIAGENLGKHEYFLAVHKECTFGIAATALIALFRATGKDSPFYNSLPVSFHIFC
jgi:hypothetical protein